MAFLSTSCSPFYIKSIGSICNLFNQPQIITCELTCQISEEMHCLKQLENYCMCDSQNVMKSGYYFANLNNCEFFDRKSLDSKSFIPTNVKTKMQLHDSRISWLCRLLEHVYDPDVIIVKQAKKIQRKCHSLRKSSYIGVSKNGPNWQAMISVDKRKSYIGTYNSEIEAAQAFDFYSLLTHGFSAKTNFNYSKTNIFDLIERFNLDYQ